MNPVRPAGSARRRSLDSNMPTNNTSNNTNSNSGNTTAGSSEAIKVLCRFRKPMAVIKANKASGSSSSSSSNNFFGNSPSSISYNEEQSETGELMVNDCYSLDLNTNSVAAAIDEVERRRFTFDKMLSPWASQASVFQELSPILEAVLSGFNGTVMAYGQTSAGKSYTMDGPSLSDENLSGVTPRSIRYLFQRLEQMSADGSIEGFQVSASYMEIYCEKIRDLLNPVSDNLQLRQKALSTNISAQNNNANTVIVVQDLTERICDSSESLFRVLEAGKTNRIIAPTLMNAESSRSHSIFSITIRIRGALENGFKKNKQGCLHLVDLAGSEKVSKTGASGARLDEAISINTSLTTLSRVITALCSNSTTSNSTSSLNHVPYRESKLTMFLRDALGGNSRTALVLCCAPEREHIPETLSTLRFGDSAKRIKNKAKANDVMSPEEMKLMLAQLKEENERLKRELQQAMSSASDQISPVENSQKNISSNTPVVETTEIDGHDEGIADQIQSKEENVDQTNFVKDDVDEPVGMEPSAFSEIETENMNSIESVPEILSFGEENESKAIPNQADSGIADVADIDIKSDSKVDELNLKLQALEFEVSELRERSAKLEEEVTWLRDTLTVKEEEIEEGRVLVQQEKSLNLSLNIEIEAVKGTMKELEQKLIDQTANQNSSSGRNISKSKSIESFPGIMEDFSSNLVLPAEANIDIVESDYVKALKNEFNSQMNRIMQRLNQEQQARAMLTERLEEADSQICSLRRRVQSAEDNAMLSQDSTSISLFSYIGRKIDANMNRASTASTAPFVSKRESLLSESLALSQSRVLELESEIGHLKEAHMIVVETKDSVLRQFIRQNSLLSIDRDEYKSKMETLQNRVSQLISLLRDREILSGNSSTSDFK